MQMSTRGRYGARVMLELALRYEGGPVSIKDIAQRQEISPKYLVQIITSLKAAGLVTSIRGSGGGYVLARPPAEITLGAVIQAMEGSMALVDCVDNARICSRADSCVTRDVWVKIKRAMDDILGSVNLERMAKMQKRKEHNCYSLMKMIEKD